jgi:hypothetical protein
MKDELNQNLQKGKLSEGAIPTNLRNSIIQKLMSDNTEMVEIRKGFETTSLPIVNLRPIIVNTNNLNNSNNSNIFKK